MYEKTFLDIGDLGVLHCIFREAQGIVVFKVLDKMVRPFEYGKLEEEIEPTSTSELTRLSGTWMGVELTDIFYYDDVDYLIHILLDCYPSMRIYPSWISGYLQSDYHDLLPAEQTQPYGFLWPPVEVMSIPEVHLDWYFRNPYGSETIDPYIRFHYGVYNVQYVTDAQIIHDILTKKWRPEPKWFTVYGRRPFTYDFKDKMKISRPIPIKATKEEIESVVAEWRNLGQWT
jgi:hypothetical protein